MIGYTAGWLILLAAYMPVAFTLGVIAFVYMWIEGTPMINATQRLIAGIDSFPLLAVPAFVLAGNAMNTGGVTMRIYEFARVIVGHVHGGLAHVNVLGSLIFSGMSGSAIADAAGLGTLEINAMRKEGYAAPFAGALTAASCIIGPLVPPSIPMVIYGVMASASVGKLFLAGIIPGLLTAGALMLYIAAVAKKRGYPRHPRASLCDLWHAFRRASLALFTPVIIMGGIFGGIFTPTEAAAVTAFYALALGLFVYRDIGWRDLPRIFRDSVNTTAIIAFIVSTASLLNWILARERVPQAMAEALLSISTDPDVILLVINLLLLFLGCFMEGMAIMLLIVPVLLPVIAEIGVDPVHFGVIVVMNLMIGILTPPFGVALFVVARVGNIPFGQLARAILPFLPPLLAVQAIITYWPSLILFLPRLVFD